MTTRQKAVGGTCSTRLKSCADGLIVYLVRHGETDWTASGRHNGRTEVPLNANGRSQADFLGKMIRDIDFDSVFCSPSIRAVQTAKIAFPSTPLTFCEELKEWDYGTLEGKTVQEIRQDIPQWTPWTHGFTGGETIYQVARRTADFATTLSRVRGSAAVISHGHTLRILCAGWLGAGMPLARHLRLDPASISVLEWEYGLPAIRRWNVYPKHSRPRLPRILEPSHKASANTRITSELNTHES
jgi:broad specificity phosphatase PhoE